MEDNKELVDDTLQEENFENVDEEAPNTTEVISEELKQEENIEFTPEPVVIERAEEPKIKKKNKTVFIIVGLVLFLAVAILGYFLFFAKSPKKTFIKVFDKQYQDFKENFNLNSMPKLFEENATIRLEMSSSDNSLNEMLKEYSKIGLNFNFAMDTEKILTKGTFDLAYDKDKLLSLDFFIDEVATYLKSKDIYSKYIKIPFEETDKSFSTSIVTNEKFEIVYEKFYSALINSLKDEYFTSSKEKVMVNGKSVNTNKTTLTINEKNIKEITNNIYENLSKDVEFLNAFADLLEVEVKDVKSALKESLTISEEIKAFEFIISFNTKGLNDELVKVVFDIDGNKLELIQINDEKLEYIISGKDLSELKGTIYYKETKDGKNTKCTLEVTMKLTVLTQTIDLKIIINNDIKEISTFDKPDIKDSKSFSELTEKDMEEIYNNIKKNEFLAEFFSKLMEF